ncbi:uncharacterized protein LOC126839359 [Adelges cooleyi]|uniref:uncharacterized protein LOC126839359 n=1 Tax=Adelges cooleyi TaxID=133065 RepID=UPI00217F73E3|nr:uncharacterized protein LOC126839359 [Adelges cooleyi]
MNTVANNHDQALVNRDKKKAEAYLKTKNVKKLIYHLTTKLLVNKPYNPVNYTILQLEELINFRKNQSNPPVLYNDEQLAGIFNNMDIMKTGSLDLEQYICVMKMLGLNEGDFNTDPERDSNNHIDRKTFMREAPIKKWIRPPIIPAYTAAESTPILNRIKFNKIK